MPLEDLLQARNLLSESETDHTPLSSSAEYGDNFVENGDDITQLENENLGAWEQVSWDVDAEEDNQSHGQGNEDEVYVIDKEKLEPVLSFLHSKLNPVTCHTLIRGYCKLEQFDKALELLRDMKKYGVRPNVDEYNKFIRSLCLKALDWETAEKLLNEMEESGLHPNGMTKALVRGVKELAGEGLEIEARIEG
ncbi:hypothetical protein K2173_019877 [Erythroxylum novogranatense]|uniref:Pentatricopeptide repeat-containing protein n=1 Tax=Erythroxylum novogranatense TaxID=1862640 RepID=A0AAV8SMQ4_9ROSI|nr:hypothetical protein K2173_019877 [Erythroxylum novogranatense]